MFCIQRKIGSVVLMTGLLFAPSAHSSPRALFSGLQSPLVAPVGKLIMRAVIIPVGVYISRLVEWPEEEYPVVMGWYVITVYGMGSYVLWRKKARVVQAVDKIKDRLAQVMCKTKRVMDQTNTRLIAWKNREKRDEA
ncbi:MAG TPA: hypothetical protein VGT41_00090 [Candidatus Babeliales bacterium]|nr:hypothetical protein [Candidatus Babeliales bacterium]